MGKQYYISDKDAALIVDVLFIRIWGLDEERAAWMESLHWAVQTGKTVFRDEPRYEDIDPRLPNPFLEYRIQMEKFVDNRNYIKSIVKDIRNNRAEKERIKKLIRRLGYDPD